MLLLRLAPILFVASTQIVAAAESLPDFATPELLSSGGDPDTMLQPLVGGPVKAGNAVDEPKLIRGLLTARQSCQGGYGLCTDGG